MLSAYEEQRAANIRQNNARLQALGLEGQRPTPAPRSAPAKRRRPPEPELGGFVRRSGRNAARVDYKEASLPGAATASGTTAAAATAAASSDASAASDDDDDDEQEDRKPQLPALPFIDDRPLAEERSTRAVSVALPALLDGVGELVDGPCTKESVVALLSGGGRPRFSKYMGALEWKNAVCLFVNVGGAEYNNLFLDGGRQVTWFAGSQQHDQTPIVRRLLGSERSANTTVLLFCPTPTPTLTLTLTLTVALTRCCSSVGSWCPRPSRTSAVARCATL